MGKALRPKAVVVIAELPKTRNAKVLRRVVRAVYLGTDLGDLSSLENHTRASPRSRRSLATR